MILKAKMKDFFIAKIYMRHNKVIPPNLKPCLLMIGRSSTERPLVPFYNGWIIVFFVMYQIRFRQVVSGRR